MNGRCNFLRFKHLLNWFSPWTKTLSPKKLTIGTWKYLLEKGETSIETTNLWVPAISLNWVFTTVIFNKSRVAQAQTWPLPEPNPTQRSFVVAPASKIWQLAMRKQTFITKFGRNITKFWNNGWCYCSSKSCCVFNDTKCYPKTSSCVLFNVLMLKCLEIWKPSVLGLQNRRRSGWYIYSIYVTYTTYIYIYYILRYRLVKPLITRYKIHPRPRYIIKQLLGFPKYFWEG